MPSRPDEQLRRRSVGRAGGSIAAADDARGVRAAAAGRRVAGDAGCARWCRSATPGRRPDRRCHGAPARAGCHTERRGRRARMRSASPRTAELLRTGAERIYSFGEPWRWDGRWLIVVLRVPGGEPSRPPSTALASRLDRARARSAAAFGSRRTWSASRSWRARSRRSPLPRRARSSPSSARSASPSSSPRMPGISSASAEQYQAFIEDFAGARALTARGVLPPADSARARVAQVPVPGSGPARGAADADWPRRQAHELFVACHERWRAQGARVLRPARGRARELAKERAA